MYEDYVPTYKINRLFGVLTNPSTYIHLGLSWLSLSVAYIYCIKAFGVSKPKLFILISIVFSILSIIHFLSHYIKEIYLINNTLTFNKLEFVFIPFLRHHQRYIDVGYSISNIKDIVYKQNFIEKLFDIGHIHFKGEVKFMAISNREYEKEQIRENVWFRKYHRIYGITNFSKLKEDLSNI